MENTIQAIPTKTHNPFGVRATILSMNNIIVHHCFYLFTKRFSLSSKLKQNQMQDAICKRLVATTHKKAALFRSGFFTYSALTVISQSAR
ncbi:MAG: hypothetical protein IJ911_00910 [Salinivirgaceae bacterium]|nr:hypothetical protein [Salinivirgaceae bacterium]